MTPRAQPSTLLLVPDLPVADEWQRAAAHHQPVIAVRVVPGPRRSSIPAPGRDGVITVTRPRLRARRFRAQAAHRLEADVLTELVDQLAAQGQPVDIAHGHFAAASTGLPGLRTRRDIPYVVSEHSSALTFDNPHKQISTAGAAAARSVYETADRVLPVSAALGDAIVRRGLARSEQLQVVPNPVDTDRFHPTDQVRRRRIVTVARLVGVKRLELLLDAVARVDDGELDVVGDGPSRTQLQAHAERLGISDRVHFHGRLDRDQVAQVLRTSSVFALSSFTENLPVAALEAMASGLPIVAPAVGGLTELLADAPGEACTPDDPAALAIALGRWLDDVDTAVSTRARRLAEDRYSIDAVGERLAAVYADVLSRRSRPTLSTTPKG